MTGTIGIEWLHGRPHKGAEEDEARAEAAALDTLEKAGVTPEAAHAAYKAQWLEFDDEAPMHGDALAWIKARQAADLAATENWHNPDGGSVTIYL
jgi:hypothetical protein